MAATLECIGIPAVSPEEINDWLARCVAATREIHRGGDVSHSLWRDYSGAAVGIHLDKGKMECITPWFTSPDGSTKWLVESTGPVLDPQCVDCSGADVDVLDAEGAIRTRAAVQLLFFRPFKDWLATKRRYRIEMAAFAERFEVYNTVEQFEEGCKKSRWLSGLQLAPEAFLPVGMFKDAGQVGLRERARAIFAGTVTKSVKRENSVSGLKFFQVRVATLPGEIDVVHPVTDALRPKPGQVALVSAWLVGRPVDPPPRTKNLLRRMLRI